MFVFDLCTSELPKVFKIPNDTLLWLAIHDSYHVRM